MTSSLAQKYQGRVPRYTSYPTAPHFGKQVDPAVYRTWLETLDPDVEVSLYVHVPFCASLCWFCGCNTKVVRSHQPVESYLETLLAEIDLVAALLPGRLRVRHVHWGGGSPTMLRPDDWRRASDRLHARFEIGQDAEIALELDPRTTTEQTVAALAAAGVTRASVGVQDMDPKVQAAIHRIQPFEVTQRVVDWLREHGIHGIGMDLMYGLPHQTAATVASTVDKAISLAPNRFAVFGYAHVPWMKPHQGLIRENTLPDSETRWLHFSNISEQLTAAGYVPVGLDHFSRPEDGLAMALAEGRLRRNFQGYTDDPATVVIAFGPSAIATLPQGYAQNATSTDAWRGEIEAGRSAVDKGVVLSSEDRLRRAVIERIMCDLGVDLAAVRSREGLEPGYFSRELEALAPMEGDGIVSIDGERVTVTAEGRPLVRVVAAAFDAHLVASETRHAAAV